MELLKVDSVEEARRKMLGFFAGAEIEHAPPGQCLGRILAEDFRPNGDIPGFDRSTVDGYAVVSKDTAAAGESIPAILSLAGEVEMGMAAGFSIKSGECAYVPTGGMLPVGADAVVMVEYSEDFGGGVALYKSAANGENVVRRGDDARAGGLLLGRGRALRFSEIGALSAAGAVSVPVYRPLRLALISTGDELAAPGGPLLPGQVYDINTPALKAYAEKNGFEVASCGLLRDDEGELASALKAAMETCDVVCVSGGSSRGKKDATARVIESVASPGIFTHGLAVKPGKPTILAFDRPTDTLMCGLPGHPVSAVIVFEALICELWRGLTGAACPPALPARLTVNIPASDGKLTYCPAKVTRDGGGYLAEPVFGKSGLITTLAGADGFFEIKRGREGLAAGEAVMVRLF